MTQEKLEIGCEPEDERTSRRKLRRRVPPELAMEIVRRRRCVFWCLALVAIGLVVAAPGDASAATLTPQQKLTATIGNIQTFLMGVGIALGGVMIVLAGVKWMMTRGKPEEQSQVKQWLMCIGVGLILIMTSTVLIEIAKGMIVK